MADKIWEDTELVTKRFPCGCIWQGHSLEVCLELTDDGRLVDCTFNLYMAGKTSLKYRLRQAWECLKGNDGQLADFIFRPQDAPELIALLNRLVTTSNTSGT